jgi:hypothetical protein
VEIPWGDLRDLDDDSLYRLQAGLCAEFVANLHPGTEDAILKVSILVKDPTLDLPSSEIPDPQKLVPYRNMTKDNYKALSALKEIFKELPPETRMPKCSECGGPIDGDASKYCGTKLSTKMRKKGRKLLKGGIISLVGVLILAALVHEFVSVHPARYIVFFGGIPALIAI